MQMGHQLDAVSFLPSLAGPALWQIREKAVQGCRAFLGPGSSRGPSSFPADIVRAWPHKPRCAVGHGR